MPLTFRVMFKRGLGVFTRNQILRGPESCKTPITSTSNARARVPAEDVSRSLHAFLINLAYDRMSGLPLARVPAEKRRTEPDRQSNKERYPMQRCCTHDAGSLPAVRRWIHFAAWAAILQNRRQEVPAKTRIRK